MIQLTQPLSDVARRQLICRVLKLEFGHDPHSDFLSPGPRAGLGPHTTWPQVEAYEKREEELLDRIRWPDQALTEHLRRLRGARDQDEKSQEAEQQFVSKLLDESGGEDDEIAHSSAKAERDCKEWLANRMKGTAPGATTKRMYLKEAQSKFSGLSIRSFQRAWADAVNASGNLEWSKPGRPKKP
jgi:hypothetical protein